MQTTLDVWNGFSCESQDVNVVMSSIVMEVVILIT